MKKLLNFEYASVQGTYWMAYGLISTFASVLLLDRGYSNGDIGMIFAVANVVAVVLQPLTADLADRSKRLSLFGVCQMTAVILMVLTWGLFVLQRKSLALTVVYVLLLAWAVAAQPLLNALAFKLSESGIHINFGMTRSLGSLAYAVICAVMGSLVERYGIMLLPASNSAILVLLLISLAVVALHFQKAMSMGIQGEEAAEAVIESSAPEVQEEINLITFVRRNKMFIFMTVGVLGIYFANGTLNNFMLQIIMPLGGNSEDMGWIFGLLAFFEIPTLVFFERINRRFSCQTLLKVASVSYIVKIVITWQADSVAVVMVSQLTQLTSYALFLPAMVQFVSEIMSKGEAVKGQAFYTTMGTIAVVLSSLVGGWVLDMSGAKTLLFISTIFTVAGTVIIFLTIDRIHINKA